ncbi:MAG TPA: tripartite tricarboxylate transporter substrate binding protein [Hyphomicrobiaceae bacterium]|nr:tripartite tricarboxylate transporter substrate binding protein [Hyphomicrobiaceae bacterium]
MLGRSIGRRPVVWAVAALAVGAMAVGPAQAQGKAPKGPGEITTGSGPGGTPDVIMRTVAKIMAEEKIVPFPVTVTNRVGGSHANAYNYVLGKKGDENLLLTMASPVFLTPIMQGTPSVVAQVTPIAGFIQSELVLQVQPDSPYKTLKEFIDAAKANPGKIRISGGQHAGTDHLATALIEKAAGVKFTYVPYDSGSAALASFLGKNVEATFGTLEEGLPIMQSGKSRALAILSERRRPEASYKDVPTMKELGYDVVFGQFWGVSGPPGMDPEIAAWWADKFQKVVQTKTWQDGLKEKFQRSDFYALEKAGAYFKKEEATFRSLMEDVGLAKK